MVRTLLVSLAFIAGPPCLGAQPIGHDHAGHRAAGDPAEVAVASLEFDHDGLRFRGDVHLPAGHGPHPGIVFLHGSGPAPRGSHLLEDLARHFAESGYAVLVYDKRGVGDSGGEFVEAPPLEVPARDGLAALRAFSTRSDVDPDRVGVWGVSQGGWVGPLMATMSDDVAFVISVSGPGVTPLEQTIFQREMELLEEGWDPADAARVSEARRAMWAYWATGEGRADAEAALARLAEEPFFGRLGWESRLTPRDELEEGSRTFFGSAGHDPIPVAESIDVPVLHVFGAKDRHIPVEASVKALRAAYASNPGADVTIQIFPDAGHGIQVVEGEAECLRCMREAHAEGHLPPIEPAPGYRDLMVEWLDARFGGGHHR